MASESRIVYVDKHPRSCETGNIAGEMGRNGARNGQNSRSGAADNPDDPRSRTRPRQEPCALTDIITPGMFQHILIMLAHGIGYLFPGPASGGVLDQGKG